MKYSGNWESFTIYYVALVSQYIVTVTNAASFAIFSNCMKTKIKTFVSSCCVIHTWMQTPERRLFPPQLFFSPPVDYGKIVFAAPAKHSFVEISRGCPLKQKYKNPFLLLLNQKMLHVITGDHSGFRHCIVTVVMSHKP